MTTDLPTTAANSLTLSAKRQVVLPSDLCAQLNLSPGSKVTVELAPERNALLVKPWRPENKKLPISRLFGCIVHHGKPVTIAEMNGVAAARKLLRGKKI